MQQYHSTANGSLQLVTPFVDLLRSYIQKLKYYPQFTGIDQYT
jgi:hypothetical protein